MYMYILCPVLSLLAVDNRRLFVTLNGNTWSLVHVTRRDSSQQFDGFIELSVYCSNHPNRPTQRNSFVESSCKSDHIISGDVITLQLHSTVLGGILLHSVRVEKFWTFRN